MEFSGCRDASVDGILSISTNKPLKLLTVLAQGVYGLLESRRKMDRSYCSVVVNVSGTQCMCFCIALCRCNCVLEVWKQPITHMRAGVGLHIQ
eukprot:5016493-Amphidinium_carterae.1